MLFCHTVEGEKERKEGWEYINTRVKIRAADKHQFCVCGSGPAHTLFSSQHFRRRFSSVTSSGATNCTQFSLPSNFFFFFSGGDFGYSSSFLADRRRNHIRLCLSEEPSPFYIILLALFFCLSRWKGFRCAAKEGKKRDTFLFLAHLIFLLFDCVPSK